MESHIWKYQGELLKSLHDCHVRVSKQWGNQKGDWVCKECGEERFAFEKRCDECHADNVEFDEMGLAA